MTNIHNALSLHSKANMNLFTAPEYKALQKHLYKKVIAVTPVYPQ